MMKATLVLIRYGARQWDWVITVKGRMNIEIVNDTTRCYMTKDLADIAARKVATNLGLIITSSKEENG